MFARHVMLRIKREMNVERGGEGTMDSHRGVRGTVCWFRLFERLRKRKRKDSSPPPVLTIM